METTAIIECPPDECTDDAIAHTPDEPRTATSQTPSLRHTHRRMNAFEVTPEWGLNNIDYVHIDTTEERKANGIHRINVFVKAMVAGTFLTLETENPDTDTGSLEREAVRRILNTIAESRKNTRVFVDA